MGLVVTAGLDRRRFIGEGKPFAHRHGFAGEQRFIGFQLTRFDQQGVRRDPVSLIEHQQIADHDFAARNPHGFAMADHQCPGRGHVAQGLKDISVRAS